MEKIKLGIVGLGQRGQGMLSTFLAFDKVDVVAICDLYQDRLDDYENRIEEARKHKVKKYVDFEEFIKDKDINAIYIASSWEAHIDQAIRCMEVGIPCGMEVGGAYNLKDCWRLVNTYERYKTPIMIMENCCYDRFELLSTALERKGLLGDVVHAHGAYSHDLRGEILGGNINRHYRLKNYISRNCENYPTHELGPIAKLLRINAGNRIVSVSSVASVAKGLLEYANSDKCLDKSLKDISFKQGDIVSTILTCENGETITMTLNTTLPGYYSREFTIFGTKGRTVQEVDMVVLDNQVEEIWNTPDFIKKYLGNSNDYKQYIPEYWNNITEEEKSLGHGGMDYFMVSNFVDCLINDQPFPLDVYDAATWYSITPLSARSIAHNGKTYKIPDFTRGKYKTNKVKDVYNFEK